MKIAPGHPASALAWPKRGKRNTICGRRHSRHFRPGTSLTLVLDASTCVIPSASGATQFSPARKGRENVKIESCERRKPFEARDAPRGRGLSQLKKRGLHTSDESLVGTNSGVYKANQ